MGWIAENRITDQELAEICKQVEEAERSNLFDGLGVSRFQPKDREQFPTKEKLLQSISPDMKLYKSTFLKIYGYEFTWPGSAEVALTKLESVGCVKAREHYKRIVGEYLEEQEKELKNAAEWYKKQVDDEFERKVMKLRKQQEVEQMKQGFTKDQLTYGMMKTKVQQGLHQKNDKELLNLLQSMKLESIAW